MKRRNEIKLKWHPYPEEKPKRTANYMVSISSGGTEYTDSSWWDSKEKQFENYLGSDVTAWAYMPRPYRKENV